jgi:glyoxylate reductase
MPRVFVTRLLPAGSLEPLERIGADIEVWSSDEPIPRSELLRRVRGVDGLLSMLTERIDDELLDAAGPSLRVVGNYAVGYDNVDVPACTGHSVLAANTPNMLHETTADLAFGLLLATARRIVEAVAFVKEGQWRYWGPNILLGAEVHHRTIGIVGMGQIGWEMAKRALGFDMRVLYYSRTRRTDLEARAPIEFVDFETLLRQSDFVSVNVALTAETRDMFSTWQFQLMQPSAILINSARGPIVDQHALYVACRDGVIAGAGIDVTDPEPIPLDDPLLTLPNVVVLPHIASATALTRLKMGQLAAENIAAVLAGREPPTPINPEVLGLKDGL